MKSDVNAVKWAKTINAISATLMLVAGVLLLCLPDLSNAAVQRGVLGALFLLTCAAKILGYFSNDLYRLAFQFDLAVGVLSGVLACAILFAPERTFLLLPVFLIAYVMFDAVLKLQIAIDAKRFGMRSWPTILTTSLVLFLVAAAVVMAMMTGRFRPTAAVGLALAADGMQNVWITMYTVRIRARKKHQSERFGLEET